MASGNLSDVVNFTCSAEGGPNNIYLWVKETDIFPGYSSLAEYLSSRTSGTGAGTGVPVDLDTIIDDLTNITSDTEELTVTIDSSYTGGNYTCAAINEAGYATGSVTLFVLPYITTQPVDVYMEVTDNTSLTCEADSFPDPMYQWERLNGSSVFKELPDEINKIFFEDIDYEEYGDYRCVVTTSNGGEAISDTVTVTGMRATSLYRTL